MKSQELQVQEQDQEVMIQLALLWWQNSRVWLIQAPPSTKDWPEQAQETGPKTIEAQYHQLKSDKQTWQPQLWKTTNSTSSQEEQFMVSSQAQRSKSSPSQYLRVYHRTRFQQRNRSTRGQIWTTPRDRMTPSHIVKLKDKNRLALVFQRKNRPILQLGLKVGWIKIYQASTMQMSKWSTSRAIRQWMISNGSLISLEMRCHQTTISHL